MSTYVYMRILESTPHRYDFGIRILSLSRVTAPYQAAADAAVVNASAPRVLEIGCGRSDFVV